jgi:hypothetical protein
MKTNLKDYLKQHILQSETEKAYWDILDFISKFLAKYEKYHIQDDDIKIRSFYIDGDLNFTIRYALIMNNDRIEFVFPFNCKNETTNVLENLISSQAYDTKSYSDTIKNMRISSPVIGNNFYYVRASKIEEIKNLMKNNFDTYINAKKYNL